MLPADNPSRKYSGAWNAIGTDGLLVVYGKREATILGFVRSAI